MLQQEQWQLSGSEPELYERYRVPRQLYALALSLLERLTLRPGQRLLDVACGTGIVARLAAPRVAPTGTVSGIDVNEGMLAVARARAAEAGLSIDWNRADAANLPFESEAFDVVLCQQGLQFFPDKRGSLREMARVLARGGTLALNVFGAQNRYNEALAKALARYVDEETASRSLAPFALGDVHTLRGLLDAAGFANVHIDSSVVTRRVEPHDGWLLTDTGATPYARSIATLGAERRAAMIREIAAGLSDLWDVDSFAVPVEVHFGYASKP